MIPRFCVSETYLAKHPLNMDWPSERMYIQSGGKLKSLRQWQGLRIL